MNFEKNRFLLIQLLKTTNNNHFGTIESFAAFQKTAILQKVDNNNK